MSEDEPRDSQENTGIATEPDESTEPNTHPEGISLADVLNVENGDAIAVRAKAEAVECILAGRVTSVSADTKNAVEKQPDERTSTVIVSIDADTWLVLADGETTDHSQELKDRPQMQEYRSTEPKDSPNCSLSYWETHRIGLTIPMPVHNGSRILYYAPDDYGTVIALFHGAMVQPEQLLPPDYTAP